MKLISFVIAIIFSCVLTFSVRQNQKLMVKNEIFKTNYNEALTNAVNDASKELIHVNDFASLELMAEGRKVNYKKVKLNLDSALDRFFETLYLNLNIDDNKISQQTVLDNIPLIVAVGYDGFYIHSWQEIKTGNELDVKNSWSEKFPFQIIDEKRNLKINYTLDDYVYIENLKTNEKFEGYQNKFKDLSSYLGEEFNKSKSQVINQLIKNKAEYYVNNNHIAQKHNWNLNFNIPYWGDRSINDISFVAFLQDELYGEKVYNTYGFGTAKIVERAPIYGYEINDKKLYSKHRKGENVTSFYDEYEAAKMGYTPDPMYYK